jgi:hypothetical protein
MISRQMQYVFLALAITAFVCYVVPFQLLIPADADRTGANYGSSYDHCKSKKRVDAGTCHG